MIRIKNKKVVGIVLGVISAMGLVGFYFGQTSSSSMDTVSWHSPFLNGKKLSGEEAANLLRKSTVSISTRFEEDDLFSNDDGGGVGSGAIVQETGKHFLVATNAHVVSLFDIFNSDITGDVDIVNYELKVDGFTPDAVYVHKYLKDIAFIKISKSSGNYKILNKRYDFKNESGKLQGKSVFAMGNPLGQDMSFTKGVVSRLSETNSKMGLPTKLVQTDAAINFGNSGGPLINEYGELIGINSLKYTKAEGISFAITIDEFDNALKNG
ncbi:MAG: trypsin-like peptidase domain-containing protein, partial [Bacteriovoracaceae bacterium]|nr:trypsin-like peptidase domain-containing protein [Bacteriovoracaceae bacterium]